MTKLVRQSSRELEVALRHIGTLPISRRKIWSQQSVFFLSMMEFCIGFGNTWRFPYIMYRNGGGVFFIPYFILLAFVGLPLVVVECILGQFTGLRPVEALAMVPVAKGVGISVLVLCFLVSINYSIIIVYTSVYFIKSFQWVLPWKNCETRWGANELCIRLIDFNGSYPVPHNTCVLMNSVTEQYWRYRVLRMNEDTSLSNVGSAQVDLLGYLFAIWIIVFLWKMRGISKMRKLVYFSTIVPYCFYIILITVTLALPGALNGLVYLVVPNWKYLLTLELWHAALSQMLFSLGICLGGLIVFSSFKTFDSRIFKYVYVLVVVDTLTSILTAIGVFSIVGYFSYQLKLDVDDVITAGPGLLFVAISEGIAHIPLSYVASAIAFFMLYFFGFSSIFVMIEVVLLAITDHWPIVKKRRPLLAFGYCVSAAAISSSCTSMGGIYILELMDKFVVEIALVLVAFFEIFYLAFLYGTLRFCDDILFMINKKPNWFWKICWTFICPAILMIGFLFAVISLQYSTYDCKPYPWWIILFGWVLVLACILPIPVWWIRKLKLFHYLPIGAKGAFLPENNWGPIDFVTKLRYRAYRKILYPTDETEDILLTNKIALRSTIPAEKVTSTIKFGTQRLVLPKVQRQQRKSTDQWVSRQNSSEATFRMTTMLCPPPHSVLGSRPPMSERFGSNVTPSSTPPHTSDSEEYQPKRVLWPKKQLQVIPERFSPSPTYSPPRTTTSGQRKKSVYQHVRHGLSQVSSLHPSIFPATSSSSRVQGRQSRPTVDLENPAPSTSQDTGEIEPAAKKLDKEPATKPKWLRPLMMRNKKLDVPSDRSIKQNPPNNSPQISPTTHRVSSLRSSIIQPKTVKFTAKETLTHIRRKFKK